MNVLFDAKHSAVHFCKMLRNTKKEIKSTHDSPPKRLLYFDISVQDVLSLHRYVPPSCPAAPNPDYHRFGGLAFHGTHWVRFSLASWLLNVGFT